MVSLVVTLTLMIPAPCGPSPDAAPGTGQPQVRVMYGYYTERVLADLALPPQQWRYGRLVFHRRGTCRS